MSMQRIVMMLMVCVLMVAPAGAGPWVDLPNTRDVWVSAYGDEHSFSMGKTDRLKLKVWQEFALFDVDSSAVRGRAVEAAEVWIYPINETVVKGRGTDLNWLTVSTVVTDWVEGEQSGTYKKDDVGGGATFNEASTGKKPWGWLGGRVYDVMLGHANSVRFDGQIEKAENGWWKMTIPPAMVEALVTGSSFGLVLMDGSTSSQQNNYLASREAGKGPYLRVKLGAKDATSPPAVAGLRVSPEPKGASPVFGAVRVAFTGPADAAAYRVRVSGQVVDPWQVPLPKGGDETFVLRDLPAGEQVTVEVGAVDAAGNLSPYAKAEVTVSTPLLVDSLPGSDWQPKGAKAVSNEQLLIWAMPAITKIGPIGGRVLEDLKATGRYRRANAVWDAGRQMVRIAAGRADIAAFQLGIVAQKGPLKRVGVTVSDLRSAAGVIPAGQIRLYRSWYVKVGDRWHSEYAVPLTGAFDIPTEDNKVERQRAQPVTVDVIVPGDAKPGIYEGVIRITAAKTKPITLRLQVVVYDVRIPDELNFNPELNCYGGPGEAGTEHFFESHRLAHYHRCTINRVPYSQDGTVNRDMLPVLKGSGKAAKVTDWSAYDRNIGPLLSGEAFKGNPRDGVPVKTFYLPMFENWPASMHEHYRPGVAVEGKDWRALHDLQAKPIDQAFSQDYKDTMVAVTRQFVEHFEAKGYTRTLIEMYLNNKPKADRMVSTAWTLDEPVKYLDWAALRFYSELFHEGIAGQTNTQFVFRGDISRPQWQGTLLDGLMEMMYANSGQFAMPWVTADWKRRTNGVLYCYGSCNPPVRGDEAVSNWESAAWCLQAYVQGCDGVLPWMSLYSGDGQALDGVARGHANVQNGLLVDGSRFGVARVASYRVFAMREGAQLVELMCQVAAKRGWTRGQMGLLASEKVRLGSQFSQAFADEASAVSYEGLSDNRFVELREGLLKMLAGK